MYDIIKEIGKVEINCEYCDKKYVYYKEDIEGIFNKIYAYVLYLKK